ncbi:hypothetical protein PTTG_02362 [Puccinia triticina 1-1 BBBD Race 1]|uniref:Uncharacterized protein n=1 Tax=Puccinia triticina (isolate 1-1 / race 1 (BBBD)) TaxID=630390 RepID=A0A0C4ENL5_PUCT1|nr:hypothetical protein PTTG_02362 [Puccinia triticina 1-1 BBBD Race 1]
MEGPESDGKELDLDQQIGSDEIELEAKDVNELSNEDESDQYTSDSSKQALAKGN